MWITVPELSGSRRIGVSTSIAFESSTFKGKYSQSLSPFSTIHEDVLHPEDVLGKTASRIVQKVADLLEEKICEKTRAAAKEVEFVQRQKGEDPVEKNRTWKFLQHDV